MANKQRYSFSAVTKVKIVFGLVMNYAIVQEDLPLNNFAKSIKIPKNTPKSVVSAPQHEVIDTIINSVHKADFSLWAICLLCTGLRRGELAAIQKKDIDFKSNTISVTKAVEFISNQPRIKNIPKTEASIGTVPILDTLKPHLIHLCENIADDDYIFGGVKPLTQCQIRKRWDKYCKTIGHKFNGHQLRHAYAKMIYKAGIDPKTAQRLLRHADFKTTMNIYTEFSKEMTDKSVSALNNYLTTF